MSDYATLNDERVVTCDLSMPYYGMWAADVGLDSAVSISQVVTLKIANLTLSGAVVRMAGFAGQRTARIVGGAGGWSKSIGPQSYYNPNGVRRSTVVRDAASAVGERVNIPSDSVMASAFVRESCPAQRVLRQVFGDVWWVDPLGVTQCAARTDVRPITSDFLVVHWSGGQGSFDIATEDVSAWTPGRTFVSPTVLAPQTISLVNIKVDGEGTLRLGVLSADQ